MLTVSQLAKQFGISRTSVLYYERVGLLVPASRSENGYRWYGCKEIHRLESILNYRSFGLPVEKLRPLMDREEEGTQEQILQDHFRHLENEIKKFRLQQSAIVKLLENSKLLEQNMVTKERWVEIMKSSGLTDHDMQNWHQQFEAMEPEAHQEFLESLGIQSDEIIRIRNWSKGDV